MTFDAYVTEIIFDRAGRAWFALGDGTIAGEGGERATAHDGGAVLAAAAHPSGEGVVSGGDDGRLVWTRGGEAKALAEIKGRWIDAVASSPTSGLIGFAAGREAHVRDAADAKFERVFAHEKTVAHLSFDPKGRRLACATYGGAMLWYARIAEQKPVPLKWAGSHILCAFSPDGRFLMSSMQENQLHGWRLSDAKDLRMGGYPTKVKSLAFVAKGMLLATAGAPARWSGRFPAPTGRWARRRPRSVSTNSAWSRGWPERPTARSWPPGSTTAGSGPATSPRATCTRSRLRRVRRSPPWP